VLAKIPALHVGILYAGLCIERYGWRTIARWKLYAFAAGVLIPTIIWYSHTRNLWVQFGNSLGISNEAYVRMTSMGSFKTLASSLIGTMRIEVSAIWTIAGCFLGLLGLLYTFKSKSYRVLLYWLIALACFYFVTGRTTGQEWATYYHIVSTPCAALLMGLSLCWFFPTVSKRYQLRTVMVASGTAGLVLFAAGFRHGPCQAI
jgi:hypothetical protein